MSLEPVTLVGGELLMAHTAATCEAPCPIHAPSAHHMVGWHQHWRGDRGMLERICPHGVGHPDPDGRLPEGGGVHGCDGCCRPPLDNRVDRSLDVVMDDRPPLPINPDEFHVDRRAHQLANEARFLTTLAASERGNPDQRVVRALALRDQAERVMEAARLAEGAVLGELHEAREAFNYWQQPKASEEA